MYIEGQISLTCMRVRVRMPTQNKFREIRQDSKKRLLMVVRVQFHRRCAQNEHPKLPLPGAVAGIAASAGTRAAMQRAAAGRVARSLYGSASQNDRAFANQMARYGSIAARSVSPALDSAVAQGQ